MTSRLIVLAGPLQGQSFSAEADTLTLGRHASNDVVIRQLSVSRRHARLERTAEGWKLADLDSLHGTFVNERAIRSRILNDGDLITLGQSLLLYREMAPDASSERPPTALPPVIEEASTAHSLAPTPEPSPPQERRRALDARRAEAATEVLIGESEKMAELRSMIARVAGVDSTVLIDGESGCGKELVARTLHAASPRSNEPFVAVNCATLSETLLESELFGHEKGAFTGAVDRRIGQFERAHGGTIFLDEVGEIPPPSQAKLLRVLQERQIERLGGRRPLAVDVRVLAATNRDLNREVAERRFRDDLFYRLNVIRLTVPPLRERRDDVPLLAHHFLFHHAKRLQRPSMALSREARAALASYDWPGNVRELSNALERAVVLAQEPVLGPEDLPEAVLECRPANTPTGDYHSALNAHKRELVRQALDATGGNVTRAAHKLGLSPNYLHRLIGNLGLRDRLDRSRQG